MIGKRLLSPLDQISARLAAAPRKLSYTGALPFEEWHAAFKKKVLSLLGPFPAPVPLNVDILEEEVVDDFEEGGIAPFTRQKVVFDTEPFASCVAYLLRPGDLKEGERRAAILNAHGHGLGKVKLATGLDPTSWIAGRDVPGPEASAIHLVNDGNVVLVPDWRCFGERTLEKEFQRPDRDPCNVSHLAFKYLGYNLLALNVWDAMRCVDLLQSLPCVDNNRIGMAGKSYGGTLAAYMAALDDRVKVVAISGYLSTLSDALSMRGRGNFCGAQFLPGLLEWGDIPDIVGLVAPRHLLIEAGTEDTCFSFEDATRAYEQLKRIYEASGHPGRLERDVADVGHEYIFNRLPGFFKEFL